MILYYNNKKLKNAKRIFRNFIKDVLVLQ